MSKAEEDLKSVETGLQQLKLLNEKPGDLVSALVLYKSLKDLALNLNAFNNEPSFAAFVGDQAPELMLWTDPVFYQFYLFPLAQSRNVEKKVDEKSPKQEKKPPVKKAKGTKITKYPLKDIIRRIMKTTRKKRDTPIYCRLR